MVRWLPTTDGSVQSTVYLCGMSSETNDNEEQEFKDPSNVSIKTIPDSRDNKTWLIINSQLYMDSVNHNLDH